jgi:hypothetical protein
MAHRFLFKHLIIKYKASSQFDRSIRSAAIVLSSLQSSLPDKNRFHYRVKYHRIISIANDTIARILMTSSDNLRIISSRRPVFGTQDDANVKSHSFACRSTLHHYLRVRDRDDSISLEIREQFLTCNRPFG